MDLIISTIHLDKDFFKYYDSNGSLNDSYDFDEESDIYGIRRNNTQFGDKNSSNIESFWSAPEN